MGVEFLRKIGSIGVAICLSPVAAVLAAGLVLLWMVIDERDRFQIDAARISSDEALTAFVDFAESQSAAFASTSIIGYSIGRYYGFAPAFAQISPDPERAAAMLRKFYAPSPADQTPEMPPALAAYASVHDRFGPSFESLIESTPFDDLYLIDHAGQVVYSLRKDAMFAADLAQPRFRDTTMAAIFREVLARQQQSADPQKIVVLSGLLSLGDGYGALLARPVIRHDVIEGVVIFKMRIAAIEQPLARLRKAGTRVLLLDSVGAPITADQPEPKGEDEYGPYPIAGTSWQYRVLAQPAALAGAWWYYYIAFAAAAVAAVAVSLRLLSRSAPAAPVPAVGLPPPAEPAPILPVEPAAEEPAHEASDHVEDRLAGDEGFRRSIVEVMTLALDYWQKSKHKGKIELAEESGLWRVYMDRSSLQTRTLDKYLLVETLPRNPRWRDVVRTAEYVLRHSNESAPERDELVRALAALKQYLRQVDRI